MTCSVAGCQEGAIVVTLPGRVPFCEDHADECGVWDGAYDTVLDPERG